MRRGSILSVLALAFGCGCTASGSPPPLFVASPLDTVQRLAVVASGETRFTVAEHSAEPGHTFDKIVKWTPYRLWLQPLAALVHEGINWLVEFDRRTIAGAELRGISARAVVADELARRLEASGRFEEIQRLDREPLGEVRRRTDAIVRVSVPAWGLVRVREAPDLVSAFADAHAQVMIRGTGVVVWETIEDVTDPERLPLDTFISQPAFTRAQLIEVLELAGHRLASELLYVRSVGR
jgi:hypothetical protein